MARDGKNLLRGYGYADYQIVSCAYNTVLTNHVLFTAMERSYEVLDIVVQVDWAAGVTDWSRAISIDKNASSGYFATLTPKTPSGTGLGGVGTYGSIHNKTIPYGNASRWLTPDAGWASTADTKAERILSPGDCILVQHASGTGAGRIFLAVLVKPYGFLRNRVGE